MDNLPQDNQQGLDALLKEQGELTARRAVILQTFKDDNVHVARIKELQARTLAEDFSTLSQEEQDAISSELEQAQANAIDPVSHWNLNEELSGINDRLYSLVMVDIRGIHGTGSE